MVAQPAVMPTSPASAPLLDMATSGLPVLSQTTAPAVSVLAAAATIVLRATTITTPSAASSEPALNPNHPNQRMNTPRTAIGMEWPGIGRGAPSGPYFPSRGPRNIAPMSAAQPPVECTTVEPAKSL